MMSFKTLTLTLIAGVGLLFAYAAPVSAAPWKNLVVFGDSGADGGSDGYDPDNSRPDPNRPPVGTSNSWNYSGKFSNGPVGIDMLYEKIGIEKDDVYNYAVGGAATGPLRESHVDYAENSPLVTGSSASYAAGRIYLNLPSQVDRYLARAGTEDNPGSDGTLVFLRIGGNDLAFQGANFGDSKCENGGPLNGCFQNEGVRNIKREMQKLVDAGYTSFAIDALDDYGDGPIATTDCLFHTGFSGTPPAGPECRTLSSEAASIANESYRTQMIEFAEENGVNIIWIDASFSLQKELSENPAAYGFGGDTTVNGATVTEVQRTQGAFQASCTGGANPSISPTPPTSATEPDATELEGYLTELEKANAYVWHDCVHRTSAGYRSWADYAAASIDTPAQVAVLSDITIDAGLTSLIERRDHLSGLHPESPNMNATYIYETLDVDESDAGRGFDNSFNGVGITYDMNMSRKWYVGGSIEYFLGDASLDDNSEIESTIRSVSLNTLYDNGVVDYMASAGHSRVEFDSIDRDLGFAGRVASGETTAEIYSLLLAVTMWRGERISHQIGLMFQDGQIASYTETGGQSLNRTIGKQNAESGQIYYMFQYRSQSPSFAPYVQIEFRDELADKALPVKVRQTGNNYGSYGFRSKAGDNVRVAVNLGLDYMLSGGTLMNIGYGFDYGDTTSRQTINLKIARQF